ncbi:ubiquitin carboxyl-terminal hydrolase 7-like isoform X2 [Leptopilina heterotoma]|uniref:ubiquitin carboxyl-terminal hydrolase 7-like isoform X2 n=1 Tax=Leptopilina heterotoma TaxID=63436 RepID=UPI001CAA00C8|nr:ubiquitin carboxyl-terminal hydrolase 7-like isoform X2 [Leptopilina heterotoma]
MPSTIGKKKSMATVQHKFSKISKMKEITLRTKPFYLENIPWRIKVQRQVTNGVLYFGFYVECSSCTIDKTKGQYAEFKMRLLSQEAGNKFIEKEVNHLFNNKENDWGFRQFLKWEELLNPDKGYIKDDSITVEVDLEIDAPYGTSKTIFRYTLSNVSTIDVEQFSAPFYLQNLPWVIRVVPRSEQTDEKPPKNSLGFFLQCNKEGELWSSYANADFRLLSHNSEQDYFNKKIEHVFSSKENEADFGDFIDWQVVFNPDKDYIKNDSIILEIHLMADSPKGESCNLELCIRTEYTFNFTIENISKMKVSKLSEPVYVGQLPWLIKVAPLTGQNQKKAIEFLGVFLQCNEEGESWACSANAELRLLSHEPGHKYFARSSSTSERRI